MFIVNNVAKANSCVNCLNLEPNLTDIEFRLLLSPKLSAGRFCYLNYAKDWVIVLANRVVACAVNILTMGLYDCSPTLIFTDSSLFKILQNGIEANNGSYENLLKVSKFFCKKRLCNCSPYPHNDTTKQKEIAKEILLSLRDELVQRNPRFNLVIS